MLFIFYFIDLHLILVILVTDLDSARIIYVMISSGMVTRDLSFKRPMLAFRRCSAQDSRCCFCVLCARVSMTNTVRAGSLSRSLDSVLTYHPRVLRSARVGSARARRIMSLLRLMRAVLSPLWLCRICRQSPARRNRCLALLPSGVPGRPLREEPRPWSRSRPLHHTRTSTWPWLDQPNESRSVAGPSARRPAHRPGLAWSWRVCPVHFVAPCRGWHAQSGVTTCWCAHARSVFVECPDRGACPVEVGNAWFVHVLGLAPAPGAVGFVLPAAAWSRCCRVRVQRSGFAVCSVAPSHAASVCAVAECAAQETLRSAPLRKLRKQYNTMQCNTIQYNTIQYNTIQYNTIQYNTIQYNTIQYNTIQYNTIQYNTIQ